MAWLLMHFSKESFPFRGLQSQMLDLGLKGIQGLHPANSGWKYDREWKIMHKKGGGGFAEEVSFGLE